ncbi:MAG TPA: hypothetical protein VK184_21725 [Nostocaceae cyanobacterium]|nr:hypothetical protein [Nostocaceae cyanobacterium]
MRLDKSIFKQMFWKLTALFLVCLIAVISLPTASAQAQGYYSVKSHKVKVKRPYYSTPDRIVTDETRPFLPYYSTQDRKKERVYTTPRTDETYTESGRRAGEVIPPDLGTGARQKNPINMLKRAGEELTNDPLQRSFGAQDYERSGIEKELIRNKAARGDYD